MCVCVGGGGGGGHVFVGIGCVGCFSLNYYLNIYLTCSTYVLLMVILASEIFLFDITQWLTAGEVGF